MPNNDPSFWENVIAAFREYGLIMCITFILSYLTISRDGREPKMIYRLRDAFIGSLLVLISGLAFKEMGLSAGWTYAFAGFVGVYGVDTIKEYARKWADKRIGK